MVYIYMIRRNLISVLILDRLKYNFLFGSKKVKLYRDSLLICNGILCGSLYILELFALPFVSTTLTSNTGSSTKRLRLNEKSSMLWHKRQSLISRQRMKRLIEDGVF